MPRVEFTSHLARHVDCPPVEAEASSLSELLDAAFELSPRLAGHILDDQNRIRQHVAIFVDNRLLRDRDSWDVPLQSDSQVFVMQALSGG
ncbi:MAG: MoaD/ThiS family protein [Planctomycetaceae bacterium]|nr:MoaD/ThiS family protein [Planctomycetaceae bacterium]